MDAVSILLLWVVAFVAVMFLIIENLNSLEESRKACHETDQRLTTNDSESKAEKEEEITAPITEEITAATEEEEITEEEEEEEELDICSEILEASRSKRDDINMEYDNDDDDWEGIERTELEKIFGEAVVFVSCKRNSDKINGDVKLQLYALQKVALEGPCHGSQPMAFNLSARAKWNAWQKLGEMSREMAMEKYVSVLVKAIPGWKVSDFC